MAKKSKKSTAGARTFRAVKATALGGGKFKVSAHSTLRDNRFTGTPSSAARKAMGRLCEMASKNKDCYETFAIIETTRGSLHKLFFYKGVSKLLPKSQWTTYKFPGSKTPIVFKRKHSIKRNGKSIPKSQWQK
jgi:hypothetical protein